MVTADDSVVGDHEAGAVVGAGGRVVVVVIVVVIVVIVVIFRVNSSDTRFVDVPRAI